MNEEPREKWCWTSASEMVVDQRRMAQREAEVTRVLVRPRERSSYDAAAWAALRRRMLTKAVQYNEMVLARLRTWLDELPAPRSPSAPPEAASSSWSSPSEHGSNGAGSPSGQTSNLAPADTASQPAVQKAEAPSVTPQHSTPSVSPWVPRSVAEAFPERSPERSTRHVAAPRLPTQKRVSAPPSKPSESRIRKRGRRWMALIAILVLAVVLAGGAVLLHHGGNSASRRPSAGSEAFALPVLRHNRPRPLSVVLSRMALIASASVAHERGAAGRVVLHVR
jgi:hypothetical protein